MVGSVYEVRPDWRVPGLVRRKTTVSRHESRGQERSGRSRSISRPTPRQTLEQTSRAHPSRRSSQSQHHGRQLRYPSLHPASPYYGQYASEDDHTSEDDELPENPYVSAPEDSRGRRRNPVGASSAAPLPQRYCPPTVSTLSTVSSRGQGSERDGDGGRDHRGAALESLQRNRERASYGRGGSQRGGVGSTAGIQQHRHPRSPQTFDLPLGQRPPPAQLTTAAPAPAPQPGLRDLLSTTGPRPHYEHPDSGMAPPRYPHANTVNTIPGLQRREGIARPSDSVSDAPSFSRGPSSCQNRESTCSGVGPSHPPSASHYGLPPERNTAHARSRLEGEGNQERRRVRDEERFRRADRLEAERLEAEMGFEQAYQASMADRRRSIRKGGNHEMAGEEGLNAARPKFNPNPIAHPLPHTSGISSRQQAPPPPPLHTRPRAFLPQQQRPTHPTAAASHHPPPPPPPSSAAPRPRIHKSRPTASNARDSLFGFSDQKERDGSSEDEGDRRADGLESTLRNPYLHPAGSGQESLKESPHKRAGEEALRSANTHPQLPSSSRQQPPPPPALNLPGRSDSRSRHLPGMPQQQQRQRPARPAEAAPPASNSSYSSTSSSSAAPRSRNPAATSRGNANANANAKAPSIGPHRGRVGVANTGPGPGPGSRPGPKREGANGVSGYGSVRKGAEFPGPSSIKTGERATPQQQRRPKYPAAAPPPPTSYPRILPPSLSNAPPSRTPVHTNATNTGPRAGGVGARSTAPGLKRDGTRSVSVGGRGNGNFPNPSSPRWTNSSRWGETPRSAGHQRAGNHAQKNGKRKEEPKPTLTQKIGYKLWVSALSCM